MTTLARTRGPIVVVAIYAEPSKVDLFRFFWRELRLTGSRFYEAEDFETALALAAGPVTPSRLIADIVPQERMNYAMRQMTAGGNVMK